VPLKNNKCKTFFFTELGPKLISVVDPDPDLQRLVFIGLSGIQEVKMAPKYRQTFTFQIFDNFDDLSVPVVRKSIFWIRKVLSAGQRSNIVQLKKTRKKFF